MHFLFIILLCTQSILASTGSIHLSDISIRSPAAARYTVEAVDLTKTVEIEAQLRNIYGTDNVVTNEHGGDSATWTITSDGNDITRNIEALELVRLVQPKDAPQSQAGEPHRRLHRRMEGIYTAYAQESTDTKETEKFLLTKIRPGTELYQIMDDDDTVAWYHLELDPDAKAAVQGYAGIVEVEDELELHTSLALPMNEVNPSHLPFPEVYGRDALVPRSGDWVKQGERTSLWL